MENHNEGRESQKWSPELLEVLLPLPEDSHIDPTVVSLSSTLVPFLWGGGHPSFWLEQILFYTSVLQLSDANSLCVCVRR